MVTYVNARVRNCYIIFLKFDYDIAEEISKD